MQNKKGAQIYVDYAASTPVDERVLEAMKSFSNGRFANARSIHSLGKQEREAIEESRSRIGKILGVLAEEVRFTSSGTDSNTRALSGVLNALQDNGMQLSDMHIIIGGIEHSSVRLCAEMYSRRGVSVSYVPVDKDGLVKLDEFENLINEKTVFVSVMMVNNEIGTIQPIQKIGKIIEEKNKERKTQITFHTDASQAPLWLKVSPKQLGVHMATFDAHKMYGPKGVGALFVQNGTPYAGLCGSKARADLDEGGTPNTGAIVGFAEAFSICEEEREGDAKNITKLRDYFFEKIEERFPEARVHGSREHRIANNINVSFPNVEGEFLVSQLSAQGVYASSRSACLSGGGEGSYVIASLDPERKNNSVRFSLGRDTHQEDIDYIISVLVDVVS